MFCCTVVLSCLARSKWQDNSVIPYVCYYERVLITELSLHFANKFIRCNRHFICTARCCSRHGRPLGVANTVKLLTFASFASCTPICLGLTETVYNSSTCRKITFCNVRNFWFFSIEIKERKQLLNTFSLLKYRNILSSFLYQQFFELNFSFKSSRPRQV